MHTGYYNSTTPVQNTDKVRVAVRGADIDPLLFDLLSQATPHGSERLLIPTIRTAIGDKASNIFHDKFGNLYVYVSTTKRITNIELKLDKDVDTIFSCHMDIVTPTPHKDKQPNVIVPLITTGNDKTGGYIYGSTYQYNKTTGARTRVPSTLGADDKVGCYIMLRMIRAKVPGLYIFHVGEEKGCLGSKYIVANHKEWLKGFKKCIAFDRMHYGDVIAFQRGSRCASEEFTNVIASRMNNAIGLSEKANDEYFFKGDVQGVYTDSAEYKDIIPECTNLSVGYWDQHSSDEHFDVVWLEKYLVPAILKVDWATLPIKRDPKVVPINYGAANNAYYARNQHVNQAINTQFVKPEDITDTTDYFQIPPRQFKDGLIEEKSDDLNKKMFMKWATTAGYHDLIEQVVPIIRARDHFRKEAYKDANQDRTLSIIDHMDNVELKLRIGIQACASHSLTISNKVLAMYGKSHSKAHKDLITKIKEHKDSIHYACRQMITESEPTMIINMCEVRSFFDSVLVLSADVLKETKVEKKLRKDVSNLQDKALDVSACLDDWEKACAELSKVA